MSSHLQSVRRARQGLGAATTLVALVLLTVVLGGGVLGSVGFRVVLACAIPVVTGLAVLASEAGWPPVGKR